MATKQPWLLHVYEDYIDIEPNSSSNFSYSIGSPPHNREIKFQNKKESTTSFNNEKLLPLHFPPHLQNATLDSVRSQSSLEDSSFPYTANLRLSSRNASIPLCNISRSESHRIISKEANPPYSKNLKQTKQSWLKASQAYIKSLLSKSGCKECQSKHVKIGRKNSFEIFYDSKRSFSGVIQRHRSSKASSLSTSSSGSSSFSFTSPHDLQLLKRGISANYEQGCSIEGAIVHCKQSQQQRVVQTKLKMMT